MSLNNLNKRNLFELKNQNRYAQLVEAQTPEPHEPSASFVGPSSAIEEQQHCKHSTPIGCDNNERAESQSLESLGIDMEATELMFTSASQGSPYRDQTITEMRANHLDAQDAGQDPKQQQFGNTQRVKTSTVSEDESKQQMNEDNNGKTKPSDSRKESQCSGQTSSSFVSTAESQQSTLAAGSSIQQTSTVNHLRVSDTNLARTISHSMLKLDQQAVLGKFEVSWRDLSFSYKPSLLASYRKKSTQVLRNISGKFSSNQLVAIIGPSGCGKTTLLQFLAGNNSDHKDKLRIVGLDEPKAAFIGQGDCLLPGLTARETLMYASRLQNSRPNFDHQKHIQPIMNELGLAECADRTVTKLSGGQAKRVTIAQELLYPTNLLILDEVTSGLDASTSYSIVRLLKQLVSDKKYPMSIVISIHQPSARLFSVFDQVYVMSEGCCLYEGSCNVDTVNSHLKRFNLECPKFHNIADYLIEIASEDASAELGIIREQMVELHRKQSQLQEQQNIYYNKNQNNRLLNRTNGIKFKSGGPTTNAAAAIDCDDVGVDSTDPTRQAMLGDTTQTNSSSLYTAIERARNKRQRPIYDHLLVHLTRSMLRIRRSYILTYLQLVTYILLGLQLSTFYGSSVGSLSGCPRLPQSFLSIVYSIDETGNNMNLEMRRIQENMNFLLVAIMTATFAALEITVITFPLEAKTVKREWRNGWYRVSSYFMGRTLADLPFQLVFVIAFCVVIYTLTGQVGVTTWRFASFVTIIIMTAMVAQTVGFIFGALFMDNLPAAVFTAPLCIFPALLFSGFFSRVSQIPTFYRPMTYLSHFRYAFDALLVTLYGYDRCGCDQTVLDSYHASQENQTSIVRDTFRSLFGSNDCAVSPNPEENSIEDTAAPTTLFMNNHTTTPAPKLPGIKMLEDALVDSVFEHMNRTATESPENNVSVMDHMVERFSNRMTTMLNIQSNFGHQVPTLCKDFNPYLMTEFDLHNDDLIFGLAMLIVFVLISRLLCNVILAFTIASRAT